MYDKILLDTEERMDKALEHLRNNLAGIRTGRANPGLVDSIRVECYGSQTPLKQLANVGCPEPQQIVIRPYDPSVIKDIEKAIVASDLGYNPQGDGRVIRIKFSGEARKHTVAETKSNFRLLSIEYVEASISFDLTFNLMDLVHSSINFVFSSHR